VKKLKQEVGRFEADMKAMKANHQQTVAELVEKYSASSSEERERYKEDSEHLKKIVTELKAERQREFMEKVQQLEKETNDLQERTKADCKREQELNWHVMILGLTFATISMHSVHFIVISEGRVLLVNYETRQHHSVLACALNLCVTPSRKKRIGYHTFKKMAP
jgi:predicted RNase H-like nuclease (RuvC/YqgF family)